MPSTSDIRPASRLWPVLALAFVCFQPALAEVGADTLNTESLNLNNERGCDRNGACTPGNETNGKITSPFQVGDTVAANYPERGDPNKYWYKSTILGVGPFGYHIRYEDDENELQKIPLERLKPYVFPTEGDDVQVLFDPIDNVIGDWDDAKVVRVNRDGTYNVVVTAYDVVLEYVTDAELRRVEKKERKRKPKKKTPFTLDPDAGFVRFLNPKLFEDPETMIDIGQRLRDGDLVVLRDAFVPEFAEAMHKDLLKMDKWELYEQHSDDGFTYHHHNVYEKQDYSEFMNATFNMFDHPDSKSFMHVLTNRDCDGTITASPSFYMPGDYSQPHTDFMDARTVAFVWHLSKNWRPEWGGALHWTPEESYHAFQHASFNTLTLFVVSPKSFHFVSTVSPYASEQRVTFNGWWNSGFMPTLDDPFEEIWATPEQRYDMSRDQWEWCINVDVQDLPEERREQVEDFQEALEFWEHPDPTAIHTVEF